MNKLQFENTVAGMVFITAEPITANDVEITQKASKAIKPDTPIYSSLDYASAQLTGFVRSDIVENMLDTLSEYVPDADRHLLVTIDNLAMKDRSAWHCGVQSKEIQKSVSLKGCKRETQVKRYNEACEYVANELEAQKADLQAGIIAEINSYLQAAIDMHNKDVKHALSKFIVEHSGVVIDTVTNDDEAASLKAIEGKAEALRKHIAELKAELGKEDEKAYHIKRQAIARSISKESGPIGQAAVEAIQQENERPKPSILL